MTSESTTSGSSKRRIGRRGGGREARRASRRAGADFIFTYFAVQAAKYLREG